MSIWGLAVTSVIYLGVLTHYWGQGRYGMALAFFAYAVANIGFLLDAYGW